MSVYNEPLDIIKKSIESILAQSYRNLEIIIIIDNPDRNDAIKHIGNINDSRIKAIINRKNLGLTASLNEGIEIANGEYIARMDADDISMPDRFKKQLDYLIKYHYDLVGSDIAQIDENGLVLKEHVVYPRNNEQIVKMLRYNSPIPHPTWFGKAEIFRDNKYIDFPACEDYELLTRLALRGIKMGNVGEVLLKYRISENGISSSKKPVQKTCLEYVRKMYRKGKESDYLSLVAFLDTKKGKRYQKNNKEFFGVIDETKKYRGKKTKLLVVLKNFPKLLNKNSISNIYSAYRARAIKNKAKKKQNKGEL